MESREAYVRVAGVTFENRQAILQGSKAGDPILLVKEPDNPHDPKAIRVLNNALSPAQSIGYIPRDRTVVFHLLMDSAALQGVEIASIGPTKDTEVLGARIKATYDYDTLQAFIDSRPGGSGTEHSPGAE
jgi:hypothetical protein